MQVQGQDPEKESRLALQRQLLRGMKDGMKATFT